MYGDWNVDGFQLVKTWGNFNATAIVARDPGGYDAQNASEYDSTFSYGPDGIVETLNLRKAGHDIPVEDVMAYALKLGYNAENWMLGAMGYWLEGDNGATWDGVEINTYGIYGGYNFTPAIQLKGVYYW